MRTLGLLLALLAMPLASARAQQTGAPAQAEVDQDLASNVNARYTVESVAITGVTDDQVSQTLRADLQALVGNRLDPDLAERLDDRLAAELPGHDVRRRISRGSQPGSIRVVFDVREAKGAHWIPFAPLRSKAVYHSDLGWSGAMDIPFGGSRNRVTVALAFGNDDDLVEEYSGYGLRIESRKVATERLGVSLEISKLHQSWRPETLSSAATDSRVPEAYRTRLTIEPLITFAFDPRVRVTAGISVSELESLSRSPESQMASAAIAAVGYGQRWESASGSRHLVEMGYQLRAATETLDSDLIYRRHLGQARYEYRQGRSTAIAALSLGRITGTAPLFERFSLGNSTTLRGWNTVDVAPAGGEGMFHQSVEYRYRGLALFVDTGSVWEQDANRKTRASTGFGYHGDNGFVTLGFPLNAGEVGATFMMGVRF